MINLKVKKKNYAAAAQQIFLIKKKCGFKLKIQLILLYFSLIQRILLYLVYGRI